VAAPSVPAIARRLVRISLRAWPLAVILVVAAILRLWHLDQNGYGRDYYAAAVRSMLACARCFVFNSFDPAGFVSLDKPPLAIWVQALSAKLFGFSGFANLLPQVVEGLAAIALVYAMVTRTFGRVAGTIAAALLAVTPAAVGVDRSNNMESCLIVLLLGATWLAYRATLTGSIAPLILSMAVLGLGFNVKMGAAWALAPVLVGLYVFWEGRNQFRRRILPAALGCVTMAIVSLSWVALYDLTPANKRPYVGSTAGNSMLELTLLHNGLNRFLPRLRDQTPPPVVTTAVPDDAGRASNTQLRRPALLDNSPTGLLRLFRPLEAGQAAWWLPLSLAGLLLLWRGWQQNSLARSQQLMIALWGGWVAIYWLVFSFAGGVVHYYYLSVLGPPLAALAGIGISQLWSRSQLLPNQHVVWALLISVTALWQVYLVYGQTGLTVPAWTTWLTEASALAALACSGLTYFTTPGDVGFRRVRSRVLLLSTCGTMMMIPLASALSVVLVRPNPSIPIANLAAYTTPPRTDWQRRGGPLANNKLVGFLQSHHDQERFLAAVPSSRLAAPLIMATGLPVMAIGGFAGADRILTPDRLRRMAQAGLVRYVVIGGARRGGQANFSLSALDVWVKQNGTLVEPSLWRSDDTGQPATTTNYPSGRNAQPQELYDLRDRTISYLNERSRSRSASYPYACSLVPL
jgi:4-amino-4-deoxy-L-arabinose transferase-like glycosyltransferase